MRDLYAFLGGVAASGARYKIEVVATATSFRADAFNAGGSTAWTAPTLVAEDPDAASVLKRAIAQFASKTKVGRDRTYTRPLTGGPDAGPFPKVAVLPEHSLCWTVGRSLALLPEELRHRAILAEGQEADAATAPPPPPPIAPTGQRPEVGQVVMLCDTLSNADALEVLIGSEHWLMTEKMEGDRNQLHHLLDGRVCLTSRGGELAYCPPHIAAEMQAMTPPGTSLDGELITLDEQARAQLYVGAKATVQLFVAFDLLAHPSYPRLLEGPQHERFRLLSLLLPKLAPPVLAEEEAIRMVPWAISESGKRQLLAEIRARHGEGVVMRNALAPYEGRRSANWQRFCDRERTLDAVVLGYKAGVGNIAGLVGAVELGLYDEAGVIHSIGWVGSGWTRTQRAEFQQRWDAGVSGYVVTVKSYGLSFADQVTRASGIRIRPAGDKQPAECRFASEVGRPYNAMGQALDAA